MARIDTLSNFLTDVADSIREKTGNTEPIACEDFDTEIESISGGGEPNLQDKSVTITENTTTTITADSGYDGLNEVEITTNVSPTTPNITNIGELNQYASAIFNNYKSFLSSIVNNYEAYTNEPITLYSPSGYPYYVIQKRSSGNYRIVWSFELNFVYIKNNNLYFNGLALKKSGSASYNTLIETYTYSLDTFVNKLFDIIIDGPTYSTSEIIAPRRFYYSNEFSTISDLINEITKPNGNITYTFWSSGYGFGAIPDSPYVIPYTNCNVLDPSNNFNVLNSRIISHNETIISSS